MKLPIKHLAEPLNDGQLRYALRSIGRFHGGAAKALHPWIIAGLIEHKLVEDGAHGSLKLTAGGWWALDRLGGRFSG